MTFPREMHTKADPSIARLLNTKPEGREVWLQGALLQVSPVDGGLSVSKR